MIAPTQPFLQVVHALVAGDAPPGELLAIREDAAYLAMRDGSVAIVINPSKRGAELEAAIREQLGADRHTHLKLVIVGGGADMREVLGRVQPGLLSRRMVQTYHLGADASVWGGHRSSLDTPMGRALQAAADGNASAVAFEELAARVPKMSAEEYADARRHHTFVQRFRERRPRLTRALLLALVCVFGLELLWGGADYLPTLVRMGANTETSLWPEPWRLLASVCLHGGEVHILANGLVLWILGGELERMLGWARLAILLVVAGLVGSLASALLSDAALSVGASGAIWGVLAAAGAISWRPRGLLPPAIVDRMRRAAGINLVINLAASFLPQVDLWAHLGGGVAGAALVLSGVLTRGLAPLHEEPAGPEPPLVRHGAVASLVALAGSLVAAIAIGRPWIVVQSPAMVEREVGGFVLDVPEPLGEPEPFDVPTGHGIAVDDSLAHPVWLLVNTHARDPDAPFEFPADPEGAPPGVAPIEVEDAIVPTFEQRWSYGNGLEEVRRYAFFPTARVTIDIAFLPGTPQVWIAAASRTLDSVRPIEGGGS